MKRMDWKDASRVYHRLRTVILAVVVTAAFAALLGPGSAEAG